MMEDLNTTKIIFISPNLVRILERDEKLGLKLSEMFEIVN